MILIPTKKNKSLIPLLFSASLLMTACDAFDDGLKPGPLSQLSFPAEMPASLRQLDPSELHVIVNVNNGDFYSRGDDIVEGRWSVPIDIQANETYDVKVSWYFSSYLVMEDHSTIVADPEQPNLSFNSEYFVTSGYPRFDSDCDGVSNYLESINGANIGPAIESPNINCNNVTIEQPDENAMNLVTHDWVFDSIEGLVDRFEQSIKIGRQNRDLDAAFHTELRSQRLEDGRSIELLQIRFMNDIGGQKVVQFNHRNAISGQAAEAPLSSCDTTGNLLRCQIQYDWQENHWYDLLISETSPGFWQAWVIDTETNERSLIGSIESEENIEWARAVSGMYYARLHDNATCTQGFPLIAAQFTGIQLNDIATHESNQSVTGDCLKIGSGWNNGKRERDDRFEYSLVIGEE